MSFRKPYNHVSQIGKNKFDDAISRYGRYFIIIRTDQRIRCPNVDPISSECNPQCPICLGLGFNFQYEKHIMRKSLNTAIGINAGEFLPYTFFIDTTVRVKETDKILEVLWSGGIVSNVLAEYNIEDVNLYYEGHSPAYQIASCVKVSVSAENQNLKYLQSIFILGVAND